MKKGAIRGMEDMLRFWQAASNPRLVGTRKYIVAMFETRGTTGDRPSLFCEDSLNCNMENCGAKVRHWSRMDWDPIVPHTK